MSDWQPIETAPKDGSPVIGYQAWWNINGGEIHITTWSENWNAWHICSASWEPTHWMPLPEPPGAHTKPGRTT